MAYADITEVETRTGMAFSDADSKRVKSLLDDAEDAIKAGFRRRGLDLDDQITAGRVTERTVIRIEVNAVERKLKNSDGKQNERIDDYSYGLEANWAKGTVGITDDEWAELLPSGRSRRRAFMIDLSGA